MRKKTVRKIVATTLAMLMLAEPPMADYRNRVEAETVTGAAAVAETGVTAGTETSDRAQENAGSSEDDSSAIKTKAKAFLSDVRLYQMGQETVSELKERVKKEGYELFTLNGNIVNINHDTGETPVCIGYKTTDKEGDAIRSLKTLEMNRGYEWFNYQVVAEGQMEKIEPLAAELILTANEFKNNLGNGSKAAGIAKDYLNYLYYSKDDSARILLGDYLSGGKTDIQTLKKFIIQMNGGSLSAMYSQLALAVSDTDKTWIERIGEAETYKMKKPSTTQNNYWDKMYYQYSLELLPVLQNFAKNYRKAQQRKSANKGKVELAKVEGKSDEPTAENAQDIMDAGNEDESSGDIMYEVAFELMNTFKIGDEKAGAYMLSIAEGSYGKRTDYRKLYPLVESLTDGQYAMMKVVGLSQMALNLNHSDEFFKDLSDKKSEIEKNIMAATGGGKQASVFAGVNTEFYEREVALTSDAYRENNAGTVYTDLTREGEFYDNMNLAFMTIGLVSSASALITSGIYLGLMIAGSSLSVWAACAGVVGTGVFMSIAGIIGCAAVITGYVALAALIIAGIVYAVKWLIDYFTDKDSEEYTKMPGEIYDIAQVTIDGEKKTEYIKYSPVTNASGSPQDINVGDGKRWQLLYYTKNEHYGSPLCVNDMGNVFARTTGTPDSPEGYEPVTCFGENTAANVKAYSKKNSNGFYLHYITEDQIDGTIYQEEEAEGETDTDDEDTSVNKGTKVKLEKGEKYLYGIMISSEDTLSAAKAAITKRTGYKVYDKNLTPKSGYTYIGYSSTTVKKDALRDIRIVPNFSGDSVRLGSGGYASAGTLPDGSSLVYTRNSKMGSPIIDTFNITSKRLSMNSIYEPVNMLCGGEAYNFSGNRKSPFYLYFKPSVAFTSGEKYIGGLQFISGRQGESTRKRVTVGSELGLTVFDVNFVPYSLFPETDTYYYSKSIRSGHGTSHTTVGVDLKYGTYVEYLYYSLTYNPYRAVYDVGVYTATTKTDSMQISLNTTEGDYAVVENTCVSDKAFFYGSLSEDLPTKTKPSKVELVRTLESRTFTDPTCGSLNPYRIQNSSYKPEKNITWESAPYLAQGLYVLGCVDGKNPLKQGDILVTTNKEEGKGMHSVQRFTDPYNSEPLSLAYQKDNNASAGVYIFLKGTAKKKGQYISGLDVVTYERPKDTEKHTYTEDELKEYNKMSDDSCRIGLLSKVDGEILNYNPAVNQGEAWYNNAGTENTDASYIGVTRTDDPNYAITGLLMYKSDTLPTVRIKVDGVEYRRTGDKMNGYYLYYTKSPGANPGVPIEEITFDNIPILDGTATAIGVSGADKDGNATFMSDFNGCNGYLHLHADTSDAIISELIIVKGNMSQAVVELMSKGFNYAVTESLNARTAGSDVYLAYKMCSADVLGLDESDIDQAGEDYDESWDDEEEDWDFDEEDFDDFDIDFDEDIPDENVVRDILCTVGKSAEKTITQGGAAYQLVSDVSLNDGTNGISLYLYYTLDDTLKKDGKETYLPPLSAIVMCSGDAVPSRGEDINKHGRWEMLVDESGAEVNLNDGVIVREEDGEYIKDCRLFLFASRYGGGVKPGAEITRGGVTSTISNGDVILSSL